MLRRQLFFGITRKSRRGFTLIELLMVIAILGITTVMAVAVVSTAGNHDRIRTSASLVQSALMGGRDRAIRAKVQQGVRFFVDPNDPTAINGFAYIGVPEDYKTGTVSVDSTGQLVTGSSDTKFTLFQTAITNSGTKASIEIDKPGNWYVINGITDDTHLTLTQKNKDLGGLSGLTYKLRLPPALLPGQEAQRFSSGIVVDANRSMIDSSTTLASYLGGDKYFDVLFSPHGTVYGIITPSKGYRLTGLMHFWLSDVQDKGNNRDPANPAAGEMFLVSLFTQTGHAGTYPVDVTDTSPNDGVADDPYKFAKTGGVAGR